MLCFVYLNCNDVYNLLLVQSILASVEDQIGLGFL